MRYFVGSDGKYVYGDFSKESGATPPSDMKELSETDFHKLVAADKAKYDLWMAASAKSDAVRDAAYKKLYDAAKKNLLAGTKLTADQAALVLGEDVPTIAGPAVPVPSFSISPFITLPALAEKRAANSKKP